MWINGYNRNPIRIKQQTELYPKIFNKRLQKWVTNRFYFPTNRRREQNNLFQTPEYIQ